MKAVVFNKESKRLDCLIIPDESRVPSLFNFFPEAHAICTVDDNVDIEGEVILSGEVILIGEGYEEEVTESAELVGMFDFNTYSKETNLEEKYGELAEKIAVNLDFIYNGGDIEEVPYKMPYYRGVIDRKEVLTNVKTVAFNSIAYRE